MPTKPDHNPREGRLEIVWEATQDAIVAYMRLVAEVHNRTKPPEDAIEEIRLLPGFPASFDSALHDLHIVAKEPTISYSLPNTPQPN